MVRRTRRLRALAAIGVLGLAVVAGCGGSEDTEAGSGDPTTSSTVEQQPLRILVTNDDGIGSPGLDQLVQGLATVPGAEITIVAPQENQSGSSDRTTDGGVTTSTGATASGLAGTAVAGFPADSVLVAINELGLDPDLVVSGVNEGQNVGPLAALSGTVGAARTAARLGVPAVAASAGLVYDAAQVQVAVDLVVEWVTANLDALRSGSLPPEVVSFNVPSCDPASMGELVDVPRGLAIPDGVNVFESTCEGVGAPADDVAAMLGGFPAETRIPIDLAPSGG